MKLKRTKLAAIAMSALMAVSTVSPYVYAEETEAAIETVTEAAAEEATEEDVEDVAEEVIEEAEAVTVEATEAVEEEEDAPAVINATIPTYAYVDVDYDKLTAEISVLDETGYEMWHTIITLVDGETVTGNTDASSTTDASWSAEYVAPGCETGGSIEISLTYSCWSIKYSASVSYDTTTGEKTVNDLTVTDSILPVDGVYTTEDTLNGKTHNTAEEVEAALSATGHHYNVSSKLFRYVDIDGKPTGVTGSTAESTKCTADGYIQYALVCEDCGKTDGWDDTIHVLNAVGHTLTGEYTLVTAAGYNVEVDKEISTAEHPNQDTYVVVDANGMLISLDHNVWLDGTTDIYPVNHSKLYTCETDENGTPVLIDTARNGYYFKMYTCPICGETVLELCEVEATQSTYAVVISSNNVAAFWYDGVRTSIENITATRTSTTTVLLNAGWKFSPALTTASTEYPIVLPDEDAVELQDCTRSGSYTIAFVTESGVIKATKTYTVKAHHMEIQVAVFATQEDMDKCTLSYDNEGNLVVTSDVCNEEITYTLAVECVAAGCASCSGSSCTKTICADTHSFQKHAEIIASLKEANVVDNGISTTTGTQVKTCQHVVLSETTGLVAGTSAAAHTKSNKINDEIMKLAAIIKSNASNGTYHTTDWVKNYISDLGTIDGYKVSAYVKVDDSTDTSTCTEAGTVDIVLYCTTCGEEEVGRYTVTVGAKGHNYPSVPEVEDLIEATCQNEGSYNAVVRCSRCGEVKSSETVVTPRLAHTNEIQGTYNSTTKNYTDDTTNSNEASTIYVEFVGTTVVDDNSSSLLNGMNAGITEYTWSGTHLIGGGDNNQDSTLGVLARVYTVCETCGEYEVELTNDRGNLKDGLVVTVEEIKAQDSNGLGGYITMSATFETTSDCVVVSAGTQTFSYYTSSTAYAGRIAADTKDDPATTTKNGLCLDNDGVFRYYQGGVFASTFTGITTYEGQLFFIANGLVDTSATGFCQNAGDLKWYWVAEGRVISEYSGLVYYNGYWFFVASGQYDMTKNGLVAYDGEQFVVSKGQVQCQYNGLWQNEESIGGDDTWYFIAAGQVQAVSQVVMYDEEFFVVENGLLADYTGTIEYDGAVFNVVAGQLYDQVAEA